MARRAAFMSYPSAGISRIRFYGFAAYPHLRPVHQHRPPRGEAHLSGNCSLSAVGLRVEFAARMTRRIRIFQVDAFTTERFTGNPAGVVLDADALTDAEMLAIARELNNADTAFVLKPDGSDHELRVRFFTPRTEASFVGHATVATHFVMSREGAPQLQAAGG